MPERRIEIPPAESELSPEKLELHNLEESGLYVFHGSEHRLDALEPRQALDASEKDGEPAVFASSSADYAIFMAVINRQNAPQGVTKEVNTTLNENNTYTPTFAASKETLDQIGENALGYVYVFNKADFSQYNKPLEFVSNKIVTPVKIIEVRKRDLPKNIDVSDWKQ